MKWLAEKLIGTGERQTGERADFLRDMHEAAPGAFWKFVFFLSMSRHRKHMPPAAWHAARLVAVRAEDCGPCTQTVVNMALADNADPQMLRAVAREDESAMSTEVWLAFRFAKAILAHDIEAEDLRGEIERRWGRGAVTDLALGMAATRVFPHVKRIMGYASACTRVTIGQEIPLQPPAYPAPAHMNAHD